MTLTNLPPPDSQNDMQTQRYQKPPDPGKQQGQPEGIFMPLDQLMGLAKGYSKYHGIVKWGAKMAGYKIPRELDEFFKELNEEGANPETLAKGQAALTGQQQQWQPPDYDAPGELPPTRIGERVLTHDLAFKAWELNKKQGLGTRQIAEYFTSELGCPCSHSTVADYINEVDDEINEEHNARRSAAIRGGAMLVIPAVAAFLVGQLLPRFL